MERLRTLKFDSIESIELYLNHLKRTDIAVGPNDRLFDFLDKCKIEYDVVEIHDSNAKLCSQELVEQINSKKSENVAICFDCSREVYILSLYYAVKKGCNLIRIDRENAKTLIEKASREYKRCCIITVEQSAAYIQTIIATLENSAFGIIAGRTFWETLYIINKSLSGYKRTIQNIVSVDRTDHITKGLSRLDVYAYIPFNDSSPEVLLESINDIADIFSFMGHGRDESLWLKNSMICGGGIQSTKTGNLPNCRITGKCFIENTEIVPIHNIPALSVFVNACLTGKIGASYYGNEYNVAQVFLGEKTITYMGTPFLGKEFEPVVHYYSSLVTAGIKTGDICKLINSFYKTFRIGIDNEFFLFGDPDYCFKSTFPIFEYGISSMEESIVFELPEKASLVVLRFDGNIVDSFFRLSKEITMSNESNQPIYCNVIHEVNAKETVFHVFSRGFLDKGIYKINIKDPKAYQQWDIDNIVRLSELLRMGLTSSKTNIFFNESVNAVDNFKQSQKYSIARLDTIKKAVYSKYHRLTSRIDSLHQSMVHDVQSKVHISGAFIEDYYMENGFKDVSRVLSDFKCRYCGNYLYDIDIVNELFGIKRKHKFCLRCGTVSSAPDKSSLDIYFECDERQRKKETNSITLCIENKGDAISTGIASVAIKSGKRYNAVYTPEQIFFKIAPTEKQRIMFEIDTKSDIPNRYSMLVGIILANSQIYTTTRGIYFYDEFVSST